MADKKKRRNVRHLISAALNFLVAFLSFDPSNPDKLLLSLSCFLMGISALLNYGGSDFQKRAARRLVKVAFILVILALIKMWFFYN